MTKSNEVIARAVVSDLYDIREDGTVYTRVSKQGHVTEVWRRSDRIDKRSSRYKVKIFDTTVEVSRLIYWKFNGPIPEGMAVDHINEIRTDNRLDNLQLLTRTENSAKTNKKNPKLLSMTTKDHVCNARFTEEDIREIRRLRAEKKTQSEIARLFGTTKGHISEICNRKTWKHI